MQQTLQITNSFTTVNLSCFSHLADHDTDVGADGGLFTDTGSDFGSLSVVGAEVLFPVLSLSWTPVR